jgi:hypothetical protein
MTRIAGSENTATHPMARRTRNQSSSCRFSWLNVSCSWRSCSACRAKVNSWFNVGPAFGKDRILRQR